LISLPRFTGGRLAVEEDGMELARRAAKQIGRCRRLCKQFNQQPPLAMVAATLAVGFAAGILDALASKRR
jgi:hypothetical protein